MFENWPRMLKELIGIGSAAAPEGVGTFGAYFLAQTFLEPFNFSPIVEIFSRGITLPELIAGFAGLYAGRFVSGMTTEYAGEQM